MTSDVTDVPASQTGKHSHGKRTQARMLALQALCIFDAVGDEFDKQLEEFIRDTVGHHDLPILTSPPPDALVFAKQLARATWKDRKRLDAWITRATPDWPIQRISPVDRNLLRLGAYELFEEADTPPEAIIDEMVEIAKIFGNADTPGFVNGKLDALRQELGVGRRGFSREDQS